MAHTNVQLVSGNLTTGGDDPTFYVDRVNNKVGIGGVPDTGGDDSSNVLQVNGSVLATKYHGDGSSLTGIENSQWLHNISDSTKIYYNGGNVGIGDDNPGSKLVVNGDIDIIGGNLKTNGTAISSTYATITALAGKQDVTNSPSFNGTSSFGSDGLLHINSRSSQYGSETVGLQTTIDGRALTEADPGTHGGESRHVLALQPDGGFVGIGTTSPNAKLHVHYDTAQSGWRDFYVRPTSLWGDGLTTASETLGTKYMTMNNVMLQNPHITPSSAGADASIRYGRAGGIQSGVWWETACVTDGSFRIRLEANDVYGITIDTSGNLVASGDVTASSDRRLKTDIKRIEGALNKVRTLGGYTFTKNDNPSTGLIAQEVLEVLPEAVHGTEETYYSIAYGNMIGILIEAIKELSDEVKELKEKNRLI